MIYTEVLLTTILDHRSLSSIIDSLHGKAIASKVHHFERAHSQVPKLKTDLAFLKRCRDSVVIPVFAQISHRLHTPSNHGVFLKASLALLRSEINTVRRDLSRFSQDLLSVHLVLSNLISPSLWAKIDACSALKSLRLEEIRGQKQAAKFQILAQKYVRGESVDEVSCSCISAFQKSALCSWASSIHSIGSSSSPLTC